MPTLRRILKYIPAAILILLLVAWAASCFGTLQINGRLGQARSFTANCAYGSFNFLEEERDSPWKMRWFPHYQQVQPSRYLGKFQYFLRPQSPRLNLVAAPIPVILSLLLPLAIGPFISFRFRLWHYLAYTALVALQLANYLRWQQ